MAEETILVVDDEEDILELLDYPVAIDLHYIIAVLKINNDLERIGDLAVNIAERAAALCSRDAVEIPFDISRMTDEVETMLEKCLNALVNLDVSLAHEVIALDDTVDDMNREMFNVVEAAIQREPQKTACLIQVLSVSRHLERIADLATNIAEDVIYMIEGQIVRHRANGE